MGGDDVPSQYICQVQKTERAMRIVQRVVAADGMGPPYQRSVKGRYWLAGTWLCVGEHQATTYSDDKAFLIVVECQQVEITQRAKSCC